MARMTIDELIAWAATESELGDGQALVGDWTVADVKRAVQLEVSFTCTLVNDLLGELEGMKVPRKAHKAYARLEKHIKRMILGLLPPDVRAQHEVTS